jgi:hypothetical protein
MANTLSLNGTFTVTIGNPINVPLSVNITISGSTDLRKTVPIALGSWQALDTSSLAVVRYLAGDNISTGSIVIASDSAGTKVIGTLQPGDNILTPWSGSMPLFAQAYNSASVLQYYLVNP